MFVYMKFESSLIYSLIAPLMICVSIIGFISSNDSKKILYLPIGLMGIFIISEKVVSRRVKRKNILKKISLYKKNK